MTIESRELTRMSAGVAPPKIGVASPKDGQHHRLTCMRIEDHVSPSPSPQSTSPVPPESASEEPARPMLRLLADGESSSARILLLGMNHRTASIELRERFVVNDPTDALVRLAEHDEIEEAVLISTCNRVELVVTTQHPAAAWTYLHRFLQHDLGSRALPSGVSIEDCTYEYEDGEAVAHVFRVASSIDSMVVGEPQILGQVKVAYRSAKEAGVCGPLLSRLFQRAFSTAKRVKNETRIGARPVSVPRVAVSLANKIFEGLGDKTALLIGAGGMIELALDALQREGLGTVRIANRTRSSAEALARRYGASAHGFEELDELLLEADVVVSCVGGEAPLLNSEWVGRTLRSRDSRPVFFIDIGVPRNIDPDVNSLDNVYLYDLDDLQEIAASNAKERCREVRRAERIIVAEQQAFEGWLTALRAVPTIRDLRNQAEEIRTRAMKRAVNSTSLGELGEEQREALDLLTRSIVNKILHGPLARLRSETTGDDGLAIIKVTRELFGLTEQDSDANRSITAPRRAATR